MIMYTKGSVITCTRCLQHIATLSRDVCSGEAVSASMFSGELKTGERTICKNCEEEWFKNGRFVGLEFPEEYKEKYETSI